MTGAPRVCVVGAGAAGLLSAGRAAELGASVTLLERNEKTGKKLYITGKGRCNLTNLCDREEFFENVVHGGKFLMSAYSRFSQEDLMKLVEAQGVPLKVERGNRVFPLSDKASDVIKALTRYAEKAGASIYLGERVKTITKNGDEFVVKTERGTETFDRVLIATGGKSYPLTGSDGDGYILARAFGHTVTSTSPSLVPLILRERVSELQGLSLKNVNLTLYRGEKSFFSEFGEMLFTDKGISGPIVLKASARLSGESLQGVTAVLDLKPALDEDTLDRRVQRDFSEANNKLFENSLNGLLPGSMVPYVVKRSGIAPEKRVNSVTREERLRLVHLLKNLSFTVVGLGGFEEAVITRGGVSLSEVNPKTMESKIVKGLFFAGELLDLDAYTGGFNLQIAFSTAYAAGTAIAAVENG